MPSTRFSGVGYNELGANVDVKVVVGRHDTRFHKEKLRKPHVVRGKRTQSRILATAENAAMNTLQIDAT